MAKEIRAKYSKGKFEPLESFDDLEEGDVVTLSIKDEWPAWKGELEEAARKAGITTEEQVVELIHEQRRTDA